MLTFCSCKVQYVVGDPPTEIIQPQQKINHTLIYMWIFVTIVGLTN